MSCVYLLGDKDKNGVYKVGATRGPIDKRIKSLQTGNSGNIYLVVSHETKHPFIVESMLHKRYEQKQVLNEWFSLTESDVNDFLTECDKIEEVLKSLQSNYFFQKKLS